MHKRRIYRLLSQSTVEYAVLLAIVAAALIAMQVYIKRGVQGRIKDLADQLSPSHYEPGTTVSNYSINQSGTTAQEYLGGIAATYQDGSYGSVMETMNRSGYEIVTPQTQ